MRSPLDVKAECSPDNTVQCASSDASAPASPGIAHQHSIQEFANPSTVRLEDFLRFAERQQPKVLDLSAGILFSSDLPAKGRASIVLVDDDELLLSALAELLEDTKYTTKSFTRSEDALEYIRGNKPDLILCEVNLKNSSFGGFS
jgi:hypothetical protein